MFKNLTLFEQEKQDIYVDINLIEESNANGEK